MSMVKDIQSCVYPVKLKNLKANHNRFGSETTTTGVVYIP